MGRVNKFTTGVFSNIVGNEKEKPLYDQFIKIQTTLNKKPTKKLDELYKRYCSKIKNNQSLFEELSLIETIIMQMRSRENINTDDIKLNIVREYIYARIPFHRDDKSGNDIRIIVGLVEKHGAELSILCGNKEIMEIAKKKLILAMDSHINDNLEKLKKQD